MATRSIKPKRLDDNMLSDWQSLPEVAPSTTRKEGTIVAQILLFVGFFLALVGIMSMVPLPDRWQYFLPAGLGYISLTVGLLMMLYHCHVDREPQFRVLYTLGAMALIVIAIFIRFLVMTRENADAYFYAIGIPMLFAALAFLIGVIRHEPDLSRTRTLRYGILFAGALMLVYAAVRGHISVDFLTTEGILFLMLGLVYVGSFIGLSGERDEMTANVAWVLVGAASANLLIVIIRSFASSTFFLPAGLIFIGVTLAAFLMAGLLLIDWPLIVLFKREMMGYFYSPIAYLVLVGCAIVFGINIYFFAQSLLRQRGMIEPIVFSYIVTWFPVICVMVLVPIVTMRIFAEEKRSGSLEVLLTAPVNEWTVVAAKLGAATLFFLVAWTPFFLFTISLRVFGGTEFDFRPLLSFVLSLAISGCALVAIGVFFSSLTANQLIAAVLTFAMMFLAVIFYFLRDTIPGNFGEFMAELSFLRLWEESGKGFVPIKLFALHAAVAVFFAYLTTLVLSARKWK